MKSLTLERLREVLHYDPTTGDLRWRVNRTRGVKAGDLAGTKNRLGYRQIGVDGRNYFAHRLAWMLHQRCEYPEMQIDHINGDRADNRAENLRLATYEQNRWNSRPRRNASGRTGVRWREHAQRWSAAIMERGKTKHLGYFDDKDSASRAYEAAARKTRGEFARIE